MKRRIQHRPTAQGRNLVVGALLVAALTVGLSTTAAAHERGHGKHARHHHVIEYRPDYPRWLRKDRQFRRWYERSHYYRAAHYHHRRPDWRRIYRVYRSSYQPPRYRYSHHVYYQPYDGHFEYGLVIRR